MSIESIKNELIDILKENDFKEVAVNRYYKYCGDSLSYAARLDDIEISMICIWEKDNKIYKNMLNTSLLEIDNSVLGPNLHFNKLIFDCTPENLY